jgi:predicted nucleic acid-binding protein
VIFLDTNYFLRYLVAPATPELRAKAETARALFEAVERSEEEVTTTEVVLHEVAYILAAKTHYNVPVADITTALRTILRLPGFRLARGQRRLYLRALDLWDAYPSLGLADAIIAAPVVQRQIPLATFDADFDRVPGVTRWQPPRGGVQSASGQP